MLQEALLAVARAGFARDAFQELAGFLAFTPAADPGAGKAERGVVRGRR